MTRTIGTQRTQRGFTLVELVVVVLVLGIIASVAAPKLFDTSGDARASATIHSLKVVRDAIELHRTQVGTYPNGQTEAAFKTNLVPYLSGPFPANKLSAAPSNSSIGVENTTNSLAGSAEFDWKYSPATGEFIISTAGYSQL